jgi:hypothetical protein
MEKIKAKWQAVKDWTAANPWKTYGAIAAASFMLALILSA